MNYIKYAFTGINILPSIFLLIIIFYWLMTILGFFSIDSGLDINTDANSDLELNSELEGDINLGNLSIASKIFEFSNMGAMPFMVYSTFYVIVLWTLSMLTYYIKISQNIFISLIIFIINFILTFFLTKIITLPLVKFFKSFNIDEKNKIIGSICTLKSTIEGEHIGLAEVENDKYPIVINVKSPNKKIEKGEQAIVISEENNNNLYIVEKNNFF
ncbi:hypothetical protein [Haliovirga abyssi]|uniref:DUF1449 family protein n=1 Tax=Haliovirga abyssi TaxID=2996794 RepID=A0AAU9DPK7_9FUSO|nr:hypothetical protein [Haliovirga abyssi]BDU50368.1 hypothetical protein HLVA_09370 [Haliovirga abyssi]